MKNKTSKLKCELCDGKMEYFLKGEDFLYRTSKKKYSLYKCNKCGWEQIIPVPSFRDVVGFYPKTYYSYNTSGKNKETKGFFLKIRERLIERYYQRSPLKDIYYYLSFLIAGLFDGLPLSKFGSNKFLDIGCGDGYNLRLMKRYGWDTLGYEIGKKQRIANIYYDTSFVNVDLGDKKFDYIRIWHVLEHTQKPRLVIKKIYKHLSDNGIVAISVPNTSGIYPKVFGKYWYGRDIPRHLINFNCRNLINLLTSEGFSIKKVKHMATGGFVGSLQHLFNDKMGMKINLIDRAPLVLAFLPLDIICNVFGTSDVITILAKKNDKNN